MADGGADEEGLLGCGDIPDIDPCDGWDNGQEHLGRGRGGDAARSQDLGCGGGRKGGAFSLRVRVGAKGGFRREVRNETRGDIRDRGSGISGAKTRVKLRAGRERGRGRGRSKGSDRGRVRGKDNGRSGDRGGQA